MLPARLVCIALLLRALVAAPGQARAGVVRGIAVAPPATSRTVVQAYPGRASALPGSRRLVSGAVTDLVVWVERIPAAAESVLARREVRARLEQRDQAFVPRVLAVAAGAVVDFPNRDPIFHNVFSVSPTRRFDLGKYPQGQSRPVTFPRPGLVDVYCDIHADMAATIVVLPNHAFTRPDADGRFALPGMPAGRYVIRWWHPDRPGGSREVEVSEHGETALEIRL